MRHPAVSRVAIDSRLLAIARAFLGTNPIPYRATLFDKSTAQNWLVPWHQDTALPLSERRDVQGWGPWSIKAGITYAHAPATALSRVIALRLHFDDSRRQRPPASTARYARARRTLGRRYPASRRRDSVSRMRRAGWRNRGHASTDRARFFQGESGCPPSGAAHRVHGLIGHRRRAQIRDCMIY
jgi:hypothetical protein